MKTCLNIFAILLIVTFANTSKSITYSDIAQSLVQLHDTPIDGLAKLGEISESFQDSNKFLEAAKTTVTDTCERLTSESQKIIGAFNKKVTDATEEVQTLTEEVIAAKKQIEKSEEAKKVEVAKIIESRTQIKNLSDNLVKRESDLNETINVLHRLKNIAKDELSGVSKINTEMKGINVVSNHGVSFIQKSNLKEELKSIMKNSIIQ